MRVLGCLQFRSPKYRTRYKELLANNFSVLEADIGEHLEWNAPYFFASLKTDLDNTTDWPRQFEWVRVVAEKFFSIFKARLAIKE